MHHYLDQMALGLRPATIERYEIWLRQFAEFLATCAPPPTQVHQINRAHIETFKTHLAERATGRDQRLARGSVRDAIVVLRCFFERLAEWDHPDAPPRVLVFAGDIPVKDRPLPRFLDDGAGAKLLRAAREHPDPFVRGRVRPPPSPAAARHLSYQPSRDQRDQDPTPETPTTTSADPPRPHPASPCHTPK